MEGMEGFPGMFEVAGDLQDVQQANEDQGWEVPPPPVPPVQDIGCEPRPRQEGEIVEENELEMVNNLANIAVNVMAARPMQHPDFPQDSYTVSSNANSFFRAQGDPVTMELPLPASGSRAAEVP